MNEPTYIVEDGQVTHRVLGSRRVAHEQHPFIIALTSHMTHQIYFEADDLAWAQIRRAGALGWRGKVYAFASAHPVLGRCGRIGWESGTLQTCIDIINTVKPPPDPFLQHEL